MKSMIVRGLSDATTMLAVALVVTCCGGLVAGSNLLYIAPIGSRSHMAFHGEIIKTLADRGHQITLVTSNSAPKHVNITEIDVKTSFMSILDNAFDDSTYTMINFYCVKVPKLCAMGLGREVVRNIDVEKYDLVFIAAFFVDCYWSLVEKTNIPIIMVATTAMTKSLHDATGNIDFPSIVPMLGSRGSYPFDFYGRFMNVIGDLGDGLMGHYYYFPNMESECRNVGMCKDNMKDLRTIMQKTSLLFINIVRQLELPPRPYVPAVIHAGGINCRPAKALPQELTSWIEGSGDHGFIYLSLGSAVTPSDMPEKSRKILLEIFRSLPQRIVWKWDEDTMEDLPKNVKLSKWLPQQDILGHPKLRLFMSHGGLFSILEATYHGVPILGMPVFAEQATNIDKVVSEGWGESVQWGELTHDDLKRKIHQIMTNKRYKEVVQHRSVLMRDEPMSPQDTVVYWTEYVIRHKGAPHMRSPVLDMSWREVYNMDVWASCVTLIIVMLTLLAWIIRTVVRRCCGTKHKVIEQKKKKL